VTDTPPPTVSIYQNADHVAGILQQLYREPLIEAERREQAAEASGTTEKERGGSANLKAKAGLAGIGSAEAAFGGQLGRTVSDVNASASKLVRNFTYSQAYYLYLVRDQLAQRSQLRQVVGASDADAVQIGEFVEFKAAFRANEMTALLDLLTPDLIAEITYYVTRSDGVKKFDAYDDFEGLRVFSEKNEITARMRAELAREVARAVRTDFRAEKTREFYGTIGAGDDCVTAITLCDVGQFVVEDEDRILDGQWTVLGKVTSSVDHDIPILQRNKVLDRAKPEGVDHLLEELRKTVDRQTDKLPGEDADAYSDMFDLEFESRVAGPSFRVVPIAVYV
jgi:hypothetical protein